MFAQRTLVILFGLCFSFSLALPIDLRHSLSRREDIELEKRVQVSWAQNADQGLTKEQKEEQEKHVHAHFQRITQEGTDPHRQATHAVINMRLHPSKGNAHHPPDPIHHLTVEFQDHNKQKIGDRAHVYRGGVGHPEAHATHQMHLAEGERQKGLAGAAFARGAAQHLLAKNAERHAANHAQEGNHDAAQRAQALAKTHHDTKKHEMQMARVHGAVRAFHHNMTKSNGIKQ